jgi:uncharacterized protein (TIGR03435 family)
MFERLFKAIQTSRSGSCYCNRCLRMSLIVHHETKIVPVCTLDLYEPGKTGSQLRSHADDAPCIDANAGRSSQNHSRPFCGGLRVWDDAAADSSHESGNKITIDTLAGFLSRDFDRPVLDHTALRGFFDFDLNNRLHP